MTMLEVLRRATGYLEQHGSGSPRLDAELLMAHVLGLRRLDLYLQFERPLSDPELAPYRELIARRGRGEPVAYLVGRKEFMKLDFEVTPEVLVPNPDTEPLVLRAIEWTRARGGPVRAVDVGTGSGCIAVALAHYVPAVSVCATDVSAAALEVAGRNAERLGVGERVAFTQGSLLEQAPARLAPAGAVLAEIDPVLVEDVVPVAERLYAGHGFHRDLGGQVRLLEAWKS